MLWRMSSSPLGSSHGILSARAARAVGLTWLGYALLYVTRKQPSVVKPELEAKLGATVGGLAALDTAFLFAYTLGQFTAGPLGDRSVWDIGLLGGYRLLYPLTFIPS